MRFEHVGRTEISSHASATPETRAGYLFNNVEAMASQGLRVLALARKRNGNDSFLPYNGVERNRT